MPIVAISRLAGSEGESVARGLADRLGYRFLDRHGLVEEARAFGVRDLRQNAPEFEERSPTIWQRLNEERRRYGVLLRAGVYGFARGDDAIILGLGASFLLRDISHALKVLIVAADSIRLERLRAVGVSATSRGAVTSEDALQRIDREWLGYVRYMFGADMLDARNYDLTLSTDRLSASATVEVLAGLLSRQELQPTSSSRQLIADRSLGSRAEVALFNHEGLWVQGLRAHAERGEVQVRGEVVTEEDRELAEQVVSALPGVARVRNELRIQPPPLTGM